MNELEGIIEELMAFVDELMVDCSEPVSPSAAEIDQLIDHIRNYPVHNGMHLPQQFFLIERVAGEILFAHNIEKYLCIESPFDLLTFHSCITTGDDNWAYLKDYLAWGKAGYMFFKHIARFNGISRFAFKVRLPMKMKDGKTYWVLQESHPLEIDKDNNILSHLNTYTISHVYSETEVIPIKAEFYYDGKYRDDWNLMFAESRHAIKPFAIVRVQHDILNYYFQTENPTTVSCAEHLKYPVNTIKKYISDCQRKRGIIDLAKSSFPHIQFSGMKDVIYFLERIGWFKRTNGYKNTP